MVAGTPLVVSIKNRTTQLTCIALVARCGADASSTLHTRTLAYCQSMKCFSELRRALSSSVKTFK